MTGLLFILGLVVVSGLVAYAGDHLGRRIGKAKMMIFGLRPKYTSILVAIITGMVITAITITTLAVSSESVRVMLFKMDKIRSDLATAQLDLEKATRDLDDAHKNLSDAQMQLDKYKADLEASDRDVILKQQLIDEKEGKLKTLGVQMSELSGQMTALNAELDSLQNRYDDVNSQLTEKTTLIANANMEIDNLESERGKLSKQIKELYSEIGNLKTERDKLQAERTDLIAKNEIMRTEGIYVYEGQILAEFVLDTNLSYEQIVDKIRKAEYDWDYVSPENVHSNQIAGLTVKQYSDVIDDISRFRARFGDQRAVIRLISAAHVFADETIPVELKAVRYLLVYKKGTVIGEKLFSTEDDRKDIRKGILEMLENLEQQALEKGMIFEGVRNAVTFDFAVVVETARKAAYYPNDFYIKLVAKKDIYNTDYLSLAPDLPEYDNMGLVIDEIEPETPWYEQQGG